MAATAGSKSPKQHKKGEDKQTIERVRRQRYFIWFIVFQLITAKFNVSTLARVRVKGWPSCRSILSAPCVLLPQCRREKVTLAGGFSAVLCSATGLLYIAALLLSDPMVPGLLLWAAPWLLSALCGATLDLLVSSPVGSGLWPFTIEDLHRFSSE